MSNGRMAASTVRCDRASPDPCVARRDGGGDEEARALLSRRWIALSLGFPFPLVLSRLVHVPIAPLHFIP